MKKQMLLSILIVSSTSVYGMEDDTSFLSCYSSLLSYFSALLFDDKVANESKIVSVLREEMLWFVPKEKNTDDHIQTLEFSLYEDNNTYFYGDDIRYLEFCK